MDNRKTLFLDTLVLVEIGKFSNWAENVRRFIERNNYVLVVGVMHLIEVHKWKKYWSEVTDFISSVPFVVPENPEKITRAEVDGYPAEITLPVAFDSTQYSYSKDELNQAIKVNLKGKVSAFEENYRDTYRSIWQGILDNRKTYLPDNGKNYSNIELKVFFLKNVLIWLYATGHQAFLQKRVSSSKEITIERFKSIYLPIVAIFVEYYINKKNGKPSDVGDFYQLGVIPYVTTSVLDNERNSLIRRISRQGLLSRPLSTYNLSEFKDLVSKT